LLAVVVFALPEVAFREVEAFVVLPRGAAIAANHLASTDVALVATDAADDGIFLLFILLGGLR
jgi:hypothetical protein